MERIKPTEVLLHCEVEPTGPWWDLSRPMVSVHKVRAPKLIFGNALMHGAHRADVIRLESLLSAGGIYLDADVFVHRSFDSLLTHSTVLGEQRIDGEVVGLCNAVILAEAKAPFLLRWYSEYKSFRSKGQDCYWDEHSVRIPYQLSTKHPEEIQVMPHTAFFWPTFSEEGIGKTFASDDPIDLSCTYASHLWESRAWRQYLEHLTPGRVRTSNTNFHLWARPLIEELPDDYGAPSLALRAVDSIRRTARRVRQSVSNRT